METHQTAGIDDTGIYFSTQAITVRGSRHETMNLKNTLWRKRTLAWAGVALAFILLAAFVSLTSAVVMSLFFALLILKVDTGIPFITALIFLLISTLMLALNQGSSAVVLANWAFFLLAIGIGIQFVNYVRSGVEKEGEQPKEATPPEP
jgi:large-conductance mechanosensitive channel